MGEDKRKDYNDKLEHMEIFKNTLDSCPVAGSGYEFFLDSRVVMAVVFR